MAENVPLQSEDTPPDYDLIVANTVGMGATLGVLIHGVNEALGEVSRPAAMTMAQGLVPVSLAGMLGKLEKLKQAIQKAQESQLRYPSRRVLIEAPAGGETSVT